MTTSRASQIHPRNSSIDELPTIWKVVYVNGMPLIVIYTNPEGSKYLPTLDLKQAHRGLIGLSKSSR